jgi:serine/threonine-protein kinase RsbW
MAGGLRHAELAGGELRLVLGNTLEAIEAGRAPLVDHLRERAVGPRALNRLEVIFEELVSNAIRHGFRAGSTQSVHVTARTAADRIELVVEDDGEPFNPLERPAPARPGSLAEAEVGGLGIALVVRLSAAIRYERPTPTASDGFQPTNRVIVAIAS